MSITQRGDAMLILMPVPGHHVPRKSYIKYVRDSVNQKVEGLTLCPHLVGSSVTTQPMVDRIQAFSVSPPAVMMQMVIVL